MHRRVPKQAHLYCWIIVVVADEPMDVDMMIARVGYMVMALWRGVRQGLRLSKVDVGLYFPSLALCFAFTLF